MTRTSIHQHSSNKPDEDYKFLRTLAREITIKMKLSVEQTHEEMTKIFDMCLKLEKGTKKLKKETTKKRNEPTD